MDLPAAVLTEAQRAYIRGEKSYSGGTERDLQSRIRSRYYAALTDLDLLAREWPVEELDQALETGRPEGGDFEEVPAAEATTPSLAALIYLTHRDVEVSGAQQDGWRTAMAVENGIEAALTDRLGVDASVSVDIEVTRRGKLSALGEEVDDLAELSEDRLTKLLRVGEISGDEHARAWVRKQERGDFDESDPPDADARDQNQHSGGDS